MPGSGSGPLGVLLMIAPLAAIPVFAIVGVPQFAPVSASQSDDDDVVDWNAPAPAATNPPPEVAPMGRAADDLFTPVKDSLPPASGGEAAPSRSNLAAGGPPVANQPGRRLPPPEALDQWEVTLTNPGTGTKQTVPPRAADSGNKRTRQPGRLEAPPDSDDDGFVSTEGFDPDLLKPDRREKARTARSAEDAPVGKSPGGRVKTDPRHGTESPAEAEAGREALAEQSGWQTAARRLKDLGIRKYRLESQIEDQTFVFTCTFTSPENPRVTRRFEADADTPLEAVQIVLEQIDEWRSKGGRGSSSSNLDDEP